MSDRRTRPLHRCKVRACPFVGAWPEGSYCPEHARDHEPYDQIAEVLRPDDDQATDALAPLKEGTP